MVIWLIVISLLVLIDITVLVVGYRKLSDRIKRIEDYNEGIYNLMVDGIGMRMAKMEDNLEVLVKNSVTTLDKLYEMKYRKFVEVPKDMKMEVELKEEN